MPPMPVRGTSIVRIDVQPARGLSGRDSSEQLRQIPFRILLPEGVTPSHQTVLSFAEQGGTNCAGTRGDRITWQSFVSARKATGANSRATWRRRGVSTFVDTSGLKMYTGSVCRIPRGPQPLTRFVWLGMIGHAPSSCRVATNRRRGAAPRPGPSAVGVGAATAGRVVVCGWVGRPHRVRVRRPAGRSVDRVSIFPPPAPKSPQIS